MAQNGTFQRDDLQFARAVTFFDAIFAFSVTLLITTVDDFSPAAWSSLSALQKANGPSLIAFTISFVVVVSFWRANHQQVTGFVALDGRVIFLNCMVMFGVVLIPFATEAIGKLDMPLPVAVYAAVISATYVMEFFVVLDADRRGLRGSRMTPRELRWDIANAVILPLVFLGSIPVAYWVSPGCRMGGSRSSFTSNSTASSTSVIRCRKSTGKGVVTATRIEVIGYSPHARRS